MRASVGCRCRLVRRSPPASRASMRRPTVSQTRERGIEPSRQQQHRPRTDKAERGGLARRERDAMHLDAARARQRAHAGIVAARCRCRRSRRWRRRFPPPARRRDRGRRRPAAPRRRGVRYRSRSARGGGDDAAAAQRHHANARLTHGDARDAGAAKAARSMPRRRSPARRSGMPGSLSPPAGSTPSPGLTVASASARPCGHLHRVERRHAVGAGRHRLAGVDPLRRRHKRYRRITAGAQSIICGKRPAVLQGHGRARARRRHCVGGKRPPGRRQPRRAGAG